MNAITVGDKFLALQTARNTMNGIDPKDDIRIGHVEPAFISVHVIKRDGKSTKLAVPRDAFGSNFENDRFHLAPPNRGYAMLMRAPSVYS